MGQINCLYVWHQELGWHAVVGKWLVQAGAVCLVGWGVEKLVPAHPAEGLSKALSQNVALSAGSRCELEHFCCIWLGNMCNSSQKEKGMVCL